MEDCVVFREYSIDGSKKMRVGSEVQDPFRDSEWIKTTAGKGRGVGEVQSRVGSRPPRGMESQDSLREWNLY